MLHPRQRLLLALTPLLVIGLVAAFLALRLAGDVGPDRLRATRDGRSGWLNVEAAPAGAPPAKHLAGSGFRRDGQGHGRG